MKSCNLGSGVAATSTSGASTGFSPGGVSLGASSQEGAGRIGRFSVSIMECSTGALVSRKSLLHGPVGLLTKTEQMHFQRTTVTSSTYTTGPYA